jgi:hypothetical protein
MQDKGFGDAMQAFVNGDIEIIAVLIFQFGAEYRFVIARIQVGFQQFNPGD